jgi:hypothetical protein
MAGKARMPSMRRGAAPGPLFEAEVAAAGPTALPRAAPWRWMPVALVAALVAAGLWGAWVTKSVLAGHDMPPIAKVQLSGIVGEYVQAQARSATPPDQVTGRDPRVHGRDPAQSRARGAAGQIVLVGEAVLAGNVPDITADVRAKSMPGSRCRRLLPPRGPT